MQKRIGRAVALGSFRFDEPIRMSILRARRNGALIAPSKNPLQPRLCETRLNQISIVPSLHFAPAFSEIRRGRQRSGYRYGRGAGVPRTRGVGVARVPVGVGVGDPAAVAVAVALAVAVAVAVGVALTAAVGVALAAGVEVAVK